MTLEAVETYRILLVEDDSITNYLHSLVLEQNGFQHINAVENGFQALNYLNEGHQVDLIFLDLNMPIMDGLEFLGKLKILDKFENIPIVILTSSILRDDIAQSTSYSNVIKYLEKPLDKSKIQAVVELMKD